MEVLTGILLVLVFVLLIAFWRYKRQVGDICRQLAFLKKHDSNMMISREIEAGHIGELAELLNDLLAARKEERKQYLEKERRIAEIYTSLSHDIRTPLTSLNGYFELLKQSVDPEEQKRYLAVIQERIESLKEMLEELFTYTKLKNTSYKLTLEPCRLNRIVKNTVFSYYDEWSAKDIEPEFILTQEPLVILGNEPAIRRVLRNLIKNGLEHGKKKIRIFLGRQDGKICLEIKNQVTDPEKIDVNRVFEQFYMADEVRSRSSTGLGLSIARELVLKMNGSIQAELTGTEFGIRVLFQENVEK